MTRPVDPPDAARLVRLVASMGASGASLRELVRAEGTERGAQKDLRRDLQALVKEGRLVRLQQGRFGLPRPEEPGEKAEKDLPGRITLHPDGFGFVRVDAGGADVFIPPRRVGGARHGDKVAVRIERVGADGRRSGFVTRIIDRTGSRIIGLVEQPAGSDALLIPLDRAAGGPYALRDDGPALDGQIVIGELPDTSPSTSFGKAPAARLLRVLGPADDMRTIEEIVIEKHSLPREYPDDAVRDAERQAETALRRLAGEAGREDFRDWLTVTIDGETARDFDDAISIQSLGGGRMRLAVHIADVSAFVPSGSAVDREAAARGTSVYFPGRVIPMLPQVLSDDLCSLRPATDRPVQTVIMDFDGEGRRVAARFADGWIHSRARLTYTQVAAHLGGSKPLPAELGDSIRLMGGLAGLLRRARAARGSLDFDLPEPLILFDIDGLAREVVAGERNDAHRLIEEFMLSANEAVAEALQRAGREALYRIHEQPDAARMLALSEAIEGLGYALPASGEVRPADLAAILDKAEGRPEQRFVQTLVLRSLMQARYSEVPALHFGLASEHYTHFTSPIRRYPDLVVHRLLRSWRRGERVGDRDALVAALAETARECSRLERAAEQAEREVLERKILALMKPRLGETHPGHVSGVTAFGLFVQLDGIFLDGLVPLETLPGGPWEHDARRHRLLGRGGRSPQGVIRLGDPITVTIARIDPIFRRVEMMAEGSIPAGPERAEGARLMAKTRPGRASSAKTEGAADRPGAAGGAKSPARRGKPASRASGARPSGRKQNQKQKQKPKPGTRRRNRK